jgi:O-antigen ligase
MGGTKTGHDPHNDFIFILITTGIIGLVVTLFLYIKTFFYILKVMLSKDNDYYWDLAFTAILAFFIMFIFQ